MPHHLIDIADPASPFSVAEFQRKGRSVLEDAVARGHPVLIVGAAVFTSVPSLTRSTSPPSSPTVRKEMEALDNAEAVSRLIAADASAGDHVDLANPRRVSRARKCSP